MDRDPGPLDAGLPITYQLVAGYFFHKFSHHRVTPTLFSHEYLSLLSHIYPNTTICQLACV
jgi:hypothetical protein